MFTVMQACVEYAKSADSESAKGWACVADTVAEVTQNPQLMELAATAARHVGREVPLDSSSRKGRGIIEETFAEYAVALDLVVLKASSCSHVVQAHEWIAAAQMIAGVMSDLAQDRIRGVSTPRFLA